MTDSQSVFTDQDHHWMSLAIKMATTARFWAKPNPNVGCVIVKDNQLLAKGCTQTPGNAHAEINALNQINHQANGATCYVTLEPCAHTGRTGPCANALVKAGVSKVIIACLDPNPLVSSKGVKILKDAGIEVLTGLLESTVNSQLNGFLTRMQTGKPLVTLKLGCSLDGNIALKNGESKWITSSNSRKDVQVHRALSGAILTSSNTVIADNPSMNVRQEEWPLKEHFANQPLKAVLDKSLNTSPDSKIYQDNAIVFYQPDLAPKNKQQAFIDKGVELIAISLNDSHLDNDLDRGLDINEVLIELGKREINDVWVECGAKLAGHLLINKHINTLILYQAPILLGASSINSMGFIIESMQDAVKLNRTEIRQIGCDTKMTYVF